MRFAPMLQETCADAFIHECEKFSGWNFSKVSTAPGFSNGLFYIEGEEQSDYCMSTTALVQLILGYKMGWEAKEP